MRIPEYPFIFSDKLKYRLQRHAAFWLVWTLFQGFLYSFVGISRPGEFLSQLPMSMLDSFIFMFAHMFLAYSLMYFIIPHFLLRQKYWQTAFFTSVLFIVAAFISTTLGKYIIDPLHAWYGIENFNRPIRPYDISIHLSLMAGLRGAITISGIAAAIKLMKYWYLKEQRNLQLQKENIASQLQLLKAQIHPHFLFNTLNNIYCYTQNTSETASRLVTGLSDMLRFILYECDQPLVPLSKELKMIRDYINLEKVRYGNKLDIHLNIPRDTEGLYIAPLLLLPLVENCFKHGTSRILEQPWISLDISLKNWQLNMKLLNGKPEHNSTNNNASGIGIQNVRKRLELLYPGKYELETAADHDIFIVNLKVELNLPAESLRTLIPQHLPAHA